MARLIPHRALRSRPVEMRRRNERSARDAAAHHFSEVAPVPFLCECSDERCESVLPMPVACYRHARAGGDFLTAPGHEVADARVARVVEHCWIYRTEARRNDAAA